MFKRTRTRFDIVKINNKSIRRRRIKRVLIMMMNDF